MPSEEAVIEHVVARIEDLVEPEPDGTQNAHSNVWTSTRRLRNDAEKPKFDFEPQEVEHLVNALRDSGRVVTWHGLIAPATDEHLEAVIENESLADEPRSILVSQCNELRQGGVPA